MKSADCHSKRNEKMQGSNEGIFNVVYNVYIYLFIYFCYSQHLGSKVCLYLDTVLQLQNSELCSPNCTIATHVQVLVMDVPQYVLERNMKRAAFLFHNYLM